MCAPKGRTRLLQTPRLSPSRRTIRFNWPLPPLLSNFEKTGFSNITQVMIELDVWVDGACFPNPGKGGWAWTTLKGEQEYGSENRTTNNIMELTAPIKAIEKLWQPDLKLIIHSDSQYVVKGMNEWVFSWIRNNWLTKDNTPVKNREHWEELFSITSGKWISFRWVKGHSGNRGNEEADRLANLAAGIKGNPFQTHAKKPIKQFNKNEIFGTDINVLTFDGDRYSFKCKFCGYIKGAMLHTLKTRLYRKKGYCRSYCMSQDLEQPAKALERLKNYG